MSLRAIFTGDRGKWIADTPAQREGNAFTELMEGANVSKCVYGHLHAYAHRNAVNAVVRNIEYRLVSGDYTEFEPVKISD